jgi:hypothetical protein
MTRQIVTTLPPQLPRARTAGRATVPRPQCNESISMASADGEMPELSGRAETRTCLSQRGSVGREDACRANARIVRYGAPGTPNSKFCVPSALQK